MSPRASLKRSSLRAFCKSIRSALSSVVHSDPGSQISMPLKEFAFEMDSGIEKHANTRHSLYHLPLPLVTVRKIGKRMNPELHPS
jgi:hypothetical protein